MSFMNAADVRGRCQTLYGSRGTLPMQPRGSKRLWLISRTDLNWIPMNSLKIWSSGYKGRCHPRRSTSALLLQEITKSDCFSFLPARANQRTDYPCIGLVLIGFPWPSIPHSPALLIYQSSTPKALSFPLEAFTRPS